MRPTRPIGMVLEYVGTEYQGFQVQAGEAVEATGAAAGNVAGRAGRAAARTVQGTVEGAITRITQERCRITGAGRTDAGVHALGQVVSFATCSRIPGDRFAPALNTVLPRDIRILRSFEAPEGFNARYDAAAKVYRYVVVPAQYGGALEGQLGLDVRQSSTAYQSRRMRLSLGAQPGSAALGGRALFIQRPLDVQAMTEASRCLVGRHDFRAFSSTGSSAKTSVRTVRRLEVRRARYEVLELDVVVVEIEADGFLYKMVRTIVGALLEIGTGLADAGLTERLLESGDRSMGPATAPPDGLYLVKVIYPERVASLVSGPVV